MAYAAVISLKRNIKRLRDRLDYEITHHTCRELESVVNILKGLDAIRNRSNRSAISALDAEIRDASWKLEDVLESYELSHYRSPSNDSGYTLVDQKSVKQEIYTFINTVKKLGEEYTRAVYRQLPREEDDALPQPVNDFGGKTVGLSDQFEKIVNELVDPLPRIKTVSLVGMAGIGKTHLAREIYQHPMVVQNFDLTAWVRVGPEQQVKNVWVDVVAEVERKPKDLYLETNIITLFELLQKIVRGRRCLIVLDDIWSTEVCGCLIRLLQADGDGRRLLLTTRLEEVAKYFKSSIHQIRFLNNEESWNLLELNVFAADESYPPQLEKVGRKIAEKCEGLPLLIIAVADILCGLEKTEEYWNKVAERKTTTFTEAYDKISKVLFSSYEYLPQHLKPCFLYMGVFPQSFEIPLSKLINLLTVEDFMEPEPSLARVIRKKKAHVKPIQQSLSMFLRTPEKEPPVSARQTQIRNRVLGYPEKVHVEPKQSVFYRTCRVQKAFETLYLLEPGPSLTRFITPFEKIDSLKRKPSLPRVIRPWPVRNFDSFEPEPEPSLGVKAFDFMATSENFTMECVEKLVSNSIAIVCKHSSKDRIKSSKLHSAYWYLCVKEARKIKFFHVLKQLSDGSEDYMESQRRLSVQNNILLGIKEVYDSMATALTARSLVCTGEDHRYPVPICFNLMFLKVLDALAVRFYEFPTEVVKLLQLRYLALTHNGELPSSISNLQQLQFMIVRQHHNIKLLKHPTSLPKEIWDMQQVRHLRIRGSNLPHPTHNAWLPNLYTLHVNAHSCTEDVFRSISNLNKLGIEIELEPDAAETMSCFEHIAILDKLESLKCVVVNPRLKSQVVAPPDHLSNLPRGLKKLCLNGLGYSWEYISAIGRLPNLQVLKLRYSAFQGEKWETEVGEFQSLSFLLLEDLDVVQWTTGDDDCFPNLRRLIIRNCYKLKEIAQVIPALEMLEVEDCSPTIVASAQQIQQETNSSVQLMIKSSWML